MRLLDILTSEEKEITNILINNGPYEYTPVTYTNSDRAQNLIYKAIQKLKTIKETETKIYIFFDIDFDGLASGYITWLLLKELSQCNPLNIIPIINKERKHGINDNIVEIINNTDNVALTIIVDSSTNLTPVFTKLNCDCVIIDHHDIEVDSQLLNGQTAGGEYTVVNNNIDHIEHKSATEVVYELWKNYAPNLLLSLQLEEWVAVSLYSDVIHSYTKQNLWFTKFLRKLRPSCDIRRIVEPLGLIEVRNGIECLSRNQISFQLVPLINSCMRMQCSAELIDTILYRPQMLPTYKSCVLKQKDLVELLYQTATIENYSDVVLAKLQKKVIAKSRNMIDVLAAQKQNKLLNSVHPSVLDGFNGLLASKISNKFNTVALVYDLVEENGKYFFKGSIRTQGKFKNINLRTLLMNKAGWTASGHSDAFGFTFDTSYGDMYKMASDVSATLTEVKQNTLHITKIPLIDYNFFSKLTNTLNNDAILDILKIAELNNLKTLTDRYCFEIKIGADFVAPSASYYSNAISEHTFTGAGPLKFKLTNYEGEKLTFNPGEVFEVYLEGTDNRIILGTLTRVT